MADQLLDQGIQSPPTHETSSTPEDLARSWLAYRGAEVQRAIAQTEDSLRFNRNYKPTSPGPTPSWVEPGGTDASDWAAAHYEYNHWPEEQAELIEYAEGELDQLDEARNAIADDMERIAAGDTAVIDRYAQLEKERRAKIEEERQRHAEKERKAEEARIGQEFDGATEVVATLDEIMQQVRTGNINETTRGPRGWKISRYIPNEASSPGGLPMRNLEHLTLEYGTRGASDMLRVSIDVSPRSDGGYGLSIKDLRNAEEIPHKEGHGNTARKGRYLDVRVNGNRGTDYAVGSLIEKRPWGYVEYGVEKTGEDFGDEEFQEVHELVEAAAIDLKGTTS